MSQYRTPVVLWSSHWIEHGTETIVNKRGEQQQVPVLVLMGVPNPDHRLTYRHDTLQLYKQATDHQQRGPV